MDLDSGCDRLQVCSPEPASDELEESSSEPDVSPVAQGSAAQAASMARQQVLQEIAVQRTLQQQQLLGNNLLRWRINHAAKNTKKTLKDAFLRAMSAQDTSAHQSDAWEAEHGTSASVSTAAERRLKALQAVVVPTAIKQQQEVRKLLQDRHRGLINALKARWQSHRDARRLRQLASTSSSRTWRAAGRSVTSTAAAAGGGASSAGASAATAGAARQAAVRDPLTHGVRGAGRDFKLPDWILGLRPGFNPDADIFWIERQWQMPPFSTAALAAEEHRRQREGAGWCGGPRTEAGLRAFEELQLRHVLAEQQQVLRRVRFRLLLSRLPGMAPLKTVPLVVVLGAGGSRSALTHAANGAVLQTQDALDALQSNIEQLRLLLSNRSAAWLQGTPLDSSSSTPATGLQGCCSDCSSMTGWQCQQQQQRSHEVQFACKQRLVAAEVQLLRQQQRIRLMHGTLPALAQQAMDKQLMQELQRAEAGRGGFGTLASPATAAAGDAAAAVGGSDSGELMSTAAAAAAARPSAGNAGMSTVPAAGTAVAFGPTRCVTEAGAAGQQQDEGDQGWECRYDAVQLRRCGLLDAAAQMWQQQHEAQLEQRQQVIAMAEACFADDDAGPAAAAPARGALDAAAPDAPQLLWGQPSASASSVASVVEQEVAQFGALWLDKYAHRIRDQSAQARKRRRASLQQRLQALQELFLSGPPIWRDVAAAGPLVDGSAEAALGRQLFSGAGAD